MRQSLAATLPFALPFALAASKLRLVAAGGAITETVFALEAAGQLVGVDTTSTYPQATRNLVSVGYMRTLSAEGVLSLAPTHLLATEDAGPPAVLRQLREAGVKVVVFDGAHRVEGMFGRVTQLGSLLGKEAQAKALLSTLQSDWAAALAHAQVGRAQRERLLKGRPMRVLFVMSHSLSQVLVAGTDSPADRMIQYIGGQNAASGFSDYKPLTAEAAIAAAPDLILATQQGLKTAGGPGGLLRLPGLADTPAGRAQRVVAMDAPLLLGFGPRLPLAVRQLSDACTAALAGAAPGAA
ncbi:MAG: hemin ABC transporter substrate-binding protein [Rubrivivax sp.]|nr:MAG: hemin ABC transporter substrate-binding protein [Rubrivivax sp.]